MTDPLELNPGAAPLQTFGTLIERTARDLTSLRFVAEWVGPGERVPVFDTVSLRAFADDVDRRIFLAELLASYTKVASGRVWSHTPRGWRRRKYSELDPLWLSELITVPEPRARRFRRSVIDPEGRGGASRCSSLRPRINPVRSRDGVEGPVRRPGRVIHRAHLRAVGAVDTHAIPASVAVVIPMVAVVVGDG